MGAAGHKSSHLSEIFFYCGCFTTKTHMHIHSPTHPHTHTQTDTTSILFLFLCFFFSCLLFCFIRPLVSLRGRGVGSPRIFSLCLLAHPPLQASQEELRVASQGVMPQVSQSLKRERALPLDITRKHQWWAGPAPTIQHPRRKEH